MTHRRRILLPRLLLAAVLGAPIITSVSGCAGSFSAEPVWVRQIAMQTPDGLCRGFVCTVNLRSRRVSMLTTDRHHDLAAWAATVGAMVAINADTAAQSTTDTHVAPHPLHARCVPCTLVFGDPAARIVTGGENTGLSSGPDAALRTARTAVGLSADRRSLVLVVIDGCPPEWSVGATLPELARVLIDSGAHTATNLAGGAASTFIYQPGASDAHRRMLPDPISNHRCTPQPPAAAGLAVIVQPRERDLAQPPN